MAATKSFEAQRFWWATAAVVAALVALAWCASGADATYYKRDINSLVWNGTIKLQLTSGEGYLNAVGTEVGYTADKDDTTTTWHVEAYIISDLLDDSVYLYNYATGRYLTYIQPVPFLVSEGVKVQTLLDPIYGRWYFYEKDNTGVFKIGSAYLLGLNYHVSFTGSTSRDGATGFRFLDVLPPYASNGAVHDI